MERRGPNGAGGGPRGAPSHYTFTVPIDPATLRGYRPPEEPKPPRDGLRGLGIGVFGTLLLVVCFLWGFDDLAAARFFVGATVIVLVLTTLALIILGYREDGLVGVYYRLSHPLGTFWGGDDRTSWTGLACAWLVMLIFTLASLLMFRFPAIRP